MRTFETNRERASAISELIQLDHSIRSMGAHQEGGVDDVYAPLMITGDDFEINLLPALTGYGISISAALNLNVSAPLDGMMTEGSESSVKGALVILRSHQRRLARVASMIELLVRAGVHHWGTTMSREREERHGRIGVDRG